MFVPVCLQFRYCNGSPCRKSELILTKSALGYPTSIFKKISGVELVIAEKLPRRPMEFVSSGFDRCVQNRSSRTAEFCTEVGSLHLEFLNRIDWRKNNKVGTVEKINCVGIVV